MKYKANRHTVTEERCDVITACDLCGEDVEQKKPDDSNVEISALIGSAWGADDSRHRHWIDCCPRCFLDRIKPAIEALGVQFRDQWVGLPEVVHEEKPARGKR